MISEKFSRSLKIDKALAKRSCEFDYELSAIFEAKSPFFKGFFMFARKYALPNFVSKDPCYIEPLDTKINEVMMLILAPLNRRLTNMYLCCHPCYFIKTAMGYLKLIYEFHEKQKKMFCKTIRMDCKLQFAVH